MAVGDHCFVYPEMGRSLADSRKDCLAAFHYEKHC